MLDNKKDEFASRPAKGVLTVVGEGKGPPSLECLGGL